MEDQDVCSICLGEIKKDDSNSHSLVCSHTFHTTCIINALRYDTRCPYCRDTGIKNERKTVPIINFDYDVGSNRELYFKTRTRITRSNIDLIEKRKKWIEELRKFRKIKAKNNSILRECLQNYFKKIRPYEKELKKERKKLKRKYNNFNNYAQDLLDMEYTSFYDDCERERIRN